MISFNLVVQPWVPVLLKDGKRAILSLEEVFLRVSEVDSIEHDSPLVVVAVHRLLLAILHRVFPVRTKNAWNELWSGNRYDPQAVMQYLQQWKTRFDLFDKDYPFYQVKSHPAAEKYQSVNKLVLYRSAGNNSVFFDHSNDSELNPLHPAEAALQLLAFQCYSPGGGKGVNGTINLMDAPLKTVLSSLIIGKNLFETLVLNMIIKPLHFDGDDGIPVWESTAKLKDEAESKINGYLDYLTILSRQVKLKPEIFNGDLMVTGVMVAQGRKAEPAVLEPFGLFRNSKKQDIIPVKVTPEKQLWRDFHSLFVFTDQSLNNYPINIYQLITLKDDNIIPEDIEYSLYCVGLATDKAKVLTWSFTSLPLPLNLPGNQDLVNLIITAMEYAEKKSKTLYFKTLEVLKILLSDINPQGAEKAAKALVSSLSTESLFWSRLEVPFKSFVLDVSRADDQETVLEKWRSQVDQIGRLCWEIVENSVANSSRGFKAIAKVSSYSSSGGNQ